MMPFGLVGQASDGRAGGDLFADVEVQRGERAGEGGAEFGVFEFP